MRQRTLKPGFFKNEDLSSMPPLERLLFAGLLLVADRAGRFEDRPARIRAEVLPYEEGIDADAMIEHLAQCGFVVRYEVDGKRYGMIPTFDLHQHPHPKEPASVIPPPVKGNGETMKGRGETLSGNERDMPRRAGSSFPSGSSDTPPPARTCEERAAALMTALRKAREVTGEDGATVLAQAMVRGKGAPILNPAVCPEPAQELWRITTERVYGYIAAWEADRKAKPKRKGGSPSWDRPDDSAASLDARAVAWIDAQALMPISSRGEVEAIVGEAPDDLRGAVTMILLARNPHLREAQSEPARKNPAPEPLPLPKNTVTVIPNHCPECDGCLTGEHRGEDYILRCGDEHGLDCTWAAVARKVAA